MSNVTFNNTQKGSVLVNPNILDKLDKNSSYNAPIVWGTGTIDKDQTIKNLGVPYQVGAHTVYSFISIESGTILVFKANGGFRVSSNGALTAVGTAASPITFTGKQKISGYWKGLEFFTNSVANKVENAVVEYAGAPGGNTEGLIGAFFNDYVKYIWL